MALIPPAFLDCVTAIGFRDAQGQTNFGATGFLFAKLVGDGATAGDKSYRIYLVTNRHVFEGSNVAVLRFNPQAGEPARMYDLNLVDPSGGLLYSLHPDPSVDVAVMDININLLNEHGIEFSYFLGDQHIMTLPMAQEHGICEGNGVFVLGFPLGDPGNVRNYVVVRDGVVARIRDAIMGASATFLIDASIFPGNSGGPVVTKPEVLSIQGTEAYSKSSLLGIVSAYVPYQDVAISAQTNRPRVIFEENTGLAVIVPVDKILEVVDIADSSVLARVEAAARTTPTV